MLLDLSLFLIMLGLILLSFGIVRQAILNPRNENIQKQIDTLHGRLTEFYESKLNSKVDE